MSAEAWTQDTLARRSALTVALALAVALALNLLFFAAAGVRGRPPAEREALLQRVDDIVRVVEAAPAPLRHKLAQAASNATFQVDWDAPATTVAVMLDAAADLAGHRTPSDYHPFMSGSRTRRSVYFDAGNMTASTTALRSARDTNNQGHYLSIELSDRSWVVFTALRRSWGMGAPARIEIGLAFLLFSIVIVSLGATWLLARPITKLSDALQRFGTDPRAASLPETGPRELRRMIRAFNAMQSRIQRFVDDRTAMLAAISHDLRTPLTRMRLRAELLDDVGQQARLFRDVDDMQAMVESALSFFRDDFTDEQTTAFDFPELLRTIVDDFGDRGTAVAYHGPAHAIFSGRPFALKRAFCNVVDNAVKYGGATHVTLAGAQGDLVISVQDSGPGIPHDMIEQVFSPFYRLERSRNRATGGVGLGLTSARAVIRGHGGDIVLRNRPVGGLEVCITLPAAP